MAADREVGASELDPLLPEGRREQKVRNKVEARGDLETPPMKGEGPLEARPAPPTSPNKGETPSGHGHPIAPTEFLKV